MGTWPRAVSTAGEEPSTAQGCWGLGEVAQRGDREGPERASDRTHSPGRRVRGRRGPGTDSGSSDNSGAQVTAPSRLSQHVWAWEPGTASLKIDLGAIIMRCVCMHVCMWWAHFQLTQPLQAAPTCKPPR